MPVIETVLNGVTIRRYDDDNRLYSDWDEYGNPLIVDAPYTEEQNLEADQRLQTLSDMQTEAILIDRAMTALDTNGLWLNRSTTPTNVQLLNHIDRLTRQNNALIRIITRVLNSLDGT